MASSRYLTALEPSQDNIDAAPSTPAGFPAGLSPREVEVIQLVAAGNSNAENAETLIISLSIITHHMSSIFNKMDSTNRTEAAIFATRHGIA